MEAGESNPTHALKTRNLLSLGNARNAKNA